MAGNLFAFPCVNIQSAGFLPSIVCTAAQEYEARELPQVKDGKPGLKLPQYREIIWKAWERAIENPRSQTRKDWEAGRARKEGLGGGSS